MVMALKEKTKMTRSNARLASIRHSLTQPPVSASVWRRGFSALLLFMGATLSGCTATSKYMAKALEPVPALAPAPGVATVAFMRPSSIGGMIKFMIIDQNGRFVGESTAGASFAVALPPGEYLFIGEGENTAVMHATLAPERLYYVEVESKMGVLYSRVGFEPIKPGSDGWQKVSEMLRDTQRFVPLAKEGQAAIDARPDVIQKRIASAKEKWAGYTEAERAELGLEPNDGVAAQPVPASPQSGSPSGEPSSTSVPAPPRT
jgi:hypothetical protein